jgi:hypothetical protein
VLIGVALDRYFLVKFFLQLLNTLMLLIAEKRRHVGMDADDDLLFLGRRAEPPDLPEDFVADGCRGFGITAAFAAGAGLAKNPQEVFPDPLPGHLDKPQFRDAKQVGL